MLMRSTTDSHEKEGHVGSLPGAVSICAGPERMGGILTCRTLDWSEEEANLPLRKAWGWGNVKGAVEIPLESIYRLGTKLLLW